MIVIAFAWLDDARKFTVGQQPICTNPHATIGDRHAMPHVMDGQAIGHHQAIPGQTPMAFCANVCAFIHARGRYRATETNGHLKVRPGDSFTMI